VSAIVNRPAECRLQVGPGIVQVKMAVEVAHSVYMVSTSLTALGLTFGQ
jgi:hypothetical protein